MPPGLTPHVRAWGERPLAVDVDFSLADFLSIRVSAAEPVVATVHPHVSFDEFSYEQRGRIFRDVRPANPQRTLELLLQGLDRTLTDGAQIVLFPELSTTPEIVDEVARHVDLVDEELLVLAGSYHVEVSGVRSNVAEILAPGIRRHHLKFAPFDQPLSPLMASRREGIAARTPKVTVYESGYERLAVVVCRDLLQPSAVPTVLADAGVSILLVPMMSESTDTFAVRAEGLTRMSQAVAAIANGPVEWSNDDDEPLAATFYPLRGPGLPDGKAAAAGLHPTYCLFAPAQAPSVVRLD